MPTEKDKLISWVLPAGLQGTRLDVFLADQGIDLSRSRLQTLIRDGHVRVNRGPAKASHRLRPGDEIFLSIPPPAPLELEPEEVRFTVLYEDEALVVVDKPAGLVVHPAPGHARGTLVHGLLRHCQDLSGIGGTLRPGIVHRLDKDTSGLLVVAKNDQAHASLAAQLKAGSMRKQYLALVHGLMKASIGEIALPIGRHPRNRKKMAVKAPGGKPALSRWQVAEAFGRGFSLLEVVIQTGRTHQIRVHLAHVGHPVVGDTVYGHGRNFLKSLNLPELAGAVERQMLHARRLGFLHPLTQRDVEFEAPVPKDMQRICEALKAV